ncbi:MAG: ABC transporter substrate-binding protein [Rhodobacteraceae bacterium]|nr:MAG: ABC transporter substrate-binding protein [Paracoccaceae bacterium]
MKQTFIAAALASTALTGAAMAQDVTLQLKWVTQAQFAGYYVALENGYYDDAGLNVTVLPGGPDIAPTQVIAGGGADVIVEWMPAALAAREKGLPLVNIAQPFKNSGLMLSCWKDSGIEEPEDFAGHTLGTWFFGNEFPLLNWLSKLELDTTGASEDSVEVMKIGFNVDPLLQRQADCVTVMTYNEYWQIMDAGVSPDDLSTFKYSDYDVDIMEDGLYVLEDSLDDPEFVAKMAKFVRASMQGWKWAEENPEEAAMIVLDYDETGAQTEEHQIRMMGEVAKLTAGSNGALDPADYERTVATLLAGGSDPVITKEPEGAWTSVVTDKALN